jgi:hypothetical protein
MDATTTRRGHSGSGHRGCRGARARDLVTLAAITLLAALLAPTSTVATSSLVQRWNNDNCTGVAAANSGEMDSGQCVAFDSDGAGSLALLCDRNDLFTLSLYAPPDTACAGLSQQITGTGDGLLCVSDPDSGSSWRVTCKVAETSRLTLTVILLLALSAAVLFMVGVCVAYQCVRVKRDGQSADRVADLETAQGVMVGDGATTQVVVSAPFAGATFKDAESGGAVPLTAVMMPPSPTVNAGPSPSINAFNRRAPALHLGASTLTAPDAASNSTHQSGKQESSAQPSPSPSSSPLHASAGAASESVASPSRQHRTRESETWRVLSLDENAGGPAFM